MVHLLSGYLTYYFRCSPNDGKLKRAMQWRRHVLSMLSMRLSRNVQEGVVARRGVRVSAMYRGAACTLRSHQSLKLGLDPSPTHDLRALPGAETGVL